MFSQPMLQSAQERFNDLLQKVGEAKKRELLGQMDAVSLPEDAYAALIWLYANSPLSDWANYPFELFLHCAQHGAMLRAQSPLARELPEDLFLNYVLHIRVNEEELCDCRGFFYGQLQPIVAGKSCRQAILAVNEWNAENVTYQSTDARTISALGAYHSAYGRCGEESTFAVNALRAVGIAARQVYTPRWAHCDDNHAWVEVYCEGEWHFLGACEPEEILDKGWFVNAASRALLIHSRCFGHTASDEVIGKKGMALFLNQTRRYAPAKTLRVLVRDDSGRPVSGAEVFFGILNYSEIFEAATVLTDANGEARLTCGHGSLFVRARKGGVGCEKAVDVSETEQIEITLSDQTVVQDAWQDQLIRAPRDSSRPAVKLTDAQKRLRREKNEWNRQKREARIQTMYDGEQAQAVVAKWGYSAEILEILKESRGNFPNLLSFLQDERYEPERKERILRSLSAKDWRDVTPAVLQDALECTPCGTPSEMYDRYVLCPRVANEPLAPCRRFLLNRLSSEQRADFSKDPSAIWSYIQQTVRFDPSVEYGQIVTLPVGALTVQNASLLSRKILFVSICRALGIPARLHPANQTPEYGRNGVFHPLWKERSCSARLTLLRQEGEQWQYHVDYSFARLEDGVYQSYRMDDENWNGHALTVSVEPGDYRLITSNRLPNGDIHASLYHFCLREGEDRRIQLHKYPAMLSEMLASYALDDFSLVQPRGEAVQASRLTEGRAAVFAWLSPGQEPTEHLLNEWMESGSAFDQLPVDLIFVVAGEHALQNDKLAQVLKQFPRIQVLYGSFGPDLEALSRRLYVDPEKFPLVMIADGRLNAVYACSGYNVGSVNMLLRICQTLDK